jgi:hypothetical protein
VGGLPILILFRRGGFPARTHRRNVACILNDRDQISERRPDGLAEPDQPPPLPFSESDPLGQLAAKNPVLDREVVDLMEELGVRRTASCEHAKKRWGSLRHRKISGLAGRIEFLAPWESPELDGFLPGGPGSVAGKPSSKPSGVPRGWLLTRKDGPRAPK